MTNSRLPPLRPDQYTPEQTRAVEAFFETRGKHLAKNADKNPAKNATGDALAGPWSIFIRSPELMDLTQSMGEYLRYRCVIPEQLRELAILLVARQWSADFEWYAHSGLARKQGISEESVAAIREGRRPADMDEMQALVHDYVSEILNTRGVSDGTYAKALAAWGEQGVVDLCGVVGYYSLLAMTMNVGRVALPGDAERLPRLPE